jgi:hypothetical protein
MLGALAMAVELIPITCAAIDLFSAQGGIPYLSETPRP